MWWAFALLLGVFSTDAFAKSDCDRHLLKDPQVRILTEFDDSQTITSAAFGAQLFFIYPARRQPVMRIAASDPDVPIRRVGRFNSIQAQIDNGIAVLDRDISGEGKVIRAYNRDTLAAVSALKAEQLGVESIQEFSFSPDRRWVAVSDADRLLTLAELDSNGVPLKTLKTGLLATPIAHLSYECIAVSEEGELLLIGTDGTIRSKTESDLFMNEKGVSISDADPAQKRVLVRHEGRVKIVDFSHDEARVALAQSIPESVTSAVFGPDANSIAFTGKAEDGELFSLETLGLADLNWGPKLGIHLRYHVALSTSANGFETGSSILRHGRGWIVVATGQTLAGMPDAFGSNATGLYLLEDALRPLGFFPSSSVIPGTVSLANIRGSIQLAYQSRTEGEHDLIRVTVDPDAVEPGNAVPDDRAIFPKLESTHDIAAKTKDIAVARIDPLIGLDFQPDGTEREPIDPAEGQLVSSGRTLAKVENGRVFHFDATTQTERKLDVPSPGWLVAGPAGSIVVFSATEREEVTLVSVFNRDGVRVWNKRIKYVYIDLKKGVAPEVTPTGFLLIPKLERTGFIVNRVYQLAEI